MLRESGIYDRLVMIGLNPSRVGPDVGQTHQKNTHEFEHLIVEQMKGLFIIYLIFCWICLFVFIVETCKVMMGEINFTNHDRI